jgi:hypothetical protein
VAVAMVVAILSGCGARIHGGARPTRPGHAGTASATVGIACGDAARELGNIGLPSSEVSSFLYANDLCVKYWP